MLHSVARALAGGVRSGHSAQAERSDALPLKAPSERIQRLRLAGAAAARAFGAGFIVGVGFA